jgi:hypothetical protein
MVSIAHHPVSPAFHDFDQQRLRILRCTARAMASTPGGLRFKPGARPWLDGLALVQRVTQAGGGGRGRCDAALSAAGDRD